MFISVPFTNLAVLVNGALAAAEAEAGEGDAD